MPPNDSPRNDGATRRARDGGAVGTRWPLLVAMSAGAVLALTWVSWRWSATARLEQSLARLRTLGVPLSLDEVPTRDVPDPGDNGAPLFLQAMELVARDRLQIDESALRPDLLPWQEALDLVRAGARRPLCVYPPPRPTGDAAPDAIAAIQLGRALRASVDAWLAQGDVGSAAADLQVLGALAGGFASTVSLLHQMVRCVLVRDTTEVAQRVLPHVEDPVTLADELARLSPRGAVARGLTGEVAWAGEIFGRDFDRCVDIFGALQPQGGQRWWGKALWVVALPYWRGEQARYLRRMADKIETCRGEYEGAPELLGSLERDRGGLLCGLAPKIRPMLDEEITTGGRLALLQLGARVIAYRRQHGTLPTDLEQVGIGRIEGSGPFELRPAANGGCVLAVPGRARWELR